MLPRTGRWYLAPAIADQAIASQLDVAEATVKSDLNAGFRKLGVRSRAEATVRILDPRNGPGVGILSIAAKDFALDVVGVT